MGRGSKTRLVTAGVLVAVFGAGVLLGLAADSNASAEAAEVGAAPIASTASVDTTNTEETQRRRRTYDEVEPNETQLALIDSIVAEHRARTRVLDEENRAQLQLGFREILLETREAIKSVLTPEQAAEYQRLLDERDTRAAERENEDERD